MSDSGPNQGEGDIQLSMIPTPANLSLLGLRGGSSAATVLVQLWTSVDEVDELCQRLGHIRKTWAVPIGGEIAAMDLQMRLIRVVLGVYLGTFEELAKRAPLSLDAIKALRGIHTQLKPFVPVLTSQSGLKEQGILVSPEPQDPLIMIKDAARQMRLELRKNHGSMALPGGTS